MSEGTALSARAEQILHSIVRAYIETGEPVASHDVSRMRRHQLSPASIRNVMAELSEFGLLSQPHTSAGRVPTSRAYSVYVQSLAQRRPAMAEVGRIRDELSQSRTFEERVERTSHMLEGMTNGVGIAAAIPTSSQILDQVELLLLGDRRVLMIVVTRDHMVRDQVILTDDPIPQEELTSIRNYLNLHFTGWKLADIHAELTRRFEQATADYHSLLSRLIQLYEKGMLDAAVQPELHMEGTANLVSFDFRITRDRLREMFRALEERKRILQLLDRFLEPPSGEVVFQIGLADGDPNLEPLSLVGISLRMPGGLTGKFAVLGPVRMDYDRALSAVRHVGQAFLSLPS
jgi:heat-inducible transcriptional repressor